MAGYIIRNRPLAVWRLSLGAIVAAAINAALEAFAFWLFAFVGAEESVGRTDALIAGHSAPREVVVGIRPEHLRPDDVRPQLYGSPTVRRRTRRAG